MIFSFTSTVDCQVKTIINQLQVNIDNAFKSASQVRYNYVVGNIVYVYKTGIWLKIYDKKQGLYIINEVFKKFKIWFQRVQVNEKLTQYG